MTGYIEMASDWYAVRTRSRPDPDPGAPLETANTATERRDDLSRERAADRTALVIQLRSWPSRLLVVLLILAGAAWMGTAIVSPAIAEYLASTATTVRDLERTVAWDPGNPDLHLRLASAYETRLGPGDLDQARDHLRTALRQRLTHASTWFRLALFEDRRGDRARARDALATAIRLDRHNVSLRWEAALLALRWGDRQQVVDHLRYVLAVDSGRRDTAFRLAKLLLPADEVAQNLLPEDADALTGILQTALGHQDLALARAAWTRRVALTPPLPAGVRRQYLEALLRAGAGAEARRIWPTLVPDRAPASAGNLIWNGGFEAGSLLGWGFDWQVRRTWGVEVTLDRFVAAEGAHSLRLTFNSFATLDFAGVFQVVAVEPGREYRLRARARALDFTTHSGLKLQVITPDGEGVLAETATVAGTTAGWVSLEARVRIPAETQLVQVRLRREKAPGPEGNLGGKVWVDEVGFLPVSGARS